MGNTRNKALLELLRQGLEYNAEKSAQISLGNRLEYLGLSDIAKYQECPRAAIASKIFLVSNTLSQLLALQRGHWFEQGLAEIFASLQMKYLTQMEISISGLEYPLKAHLDFTLVWDMPYQAIRIVEVKSVGKLPQEPYQAHVFQAQGQVDLLCQNWNKPVFSLRNESGELIIQNAAFPEICRAQLDISLPESPDKISVESWLLYLSGSDAVCFGPYQYDKGNLDILHDTAKKMWQGYKSVYADSSKLESIRHAAGYYPLCAYCHVSSDCPKFRNIETALEWNGALDKLMTLKNQKSVLEEQIKAIETDLKSVSENMGCKDWLQTDSYRFRTVPVSGRKMLDKGLLLKELCDLCEHYGIVEMTPESIISRCEKQSLPSSRLQILPVQ